MLRGWPFNTKIPSRVSCVLLNLYTRQTRQARGSLIRLATLLFWSGKCEGNSSPVEEKIRSICEGIFPFIETNDEDSKIDSITKGVGSWVW